MKQTMTILKLSLAMALLVTVTACDSKKDSKSSISRRNSRYNNYDNTDPRNFGPNGSGSYSNSQCANCGVIYGGDLTSAAQDFVGDPGAVGTVSGQPGSQTGIVFLGNVDSYGRDGYVAIVIWDSMASQYGEPFVVEMELDPESTRLSQYNGTVVFRDNYGSLVFNGQFSGGMFQGSVSFNNTDGIQRPFGSFQVGECSFVRCR